MGERQTTEPKQVNADHLHEIRGENEGIRSSSPSQMSVFDGAGNESIVVIGEDPDGRRKEGTGASAAEAEKDLRNTREPIGEGFYPPPK